MATREAIEAFLEQMQNLSKINIIPTRKNRLTRYRLGITIEDQESLIRGLTVDDYTSGPEKDHDPTRQGDIWKFQKTCYGYLFYFKFKLDIANDRIDALSCHIDDMYQIY